MPTPSKFTAETRSTILEALKVGAPLYTAAQIADIDRVTLHRWLKQGEKAKEGSRFREFLQDVRAAEEHPKIRALGIIYKELPDNPALAWKFVERRVEGFGPPRPQAPRLPAGPLRIQLSFSDSRPFESGPPMIEGEVIEEPDDVLGLPPPDPAPRWSARSPTVAPG